MIRAAVILCAAVLWAAQSAFAGTWTGTASFKSGESATYVFTAADTTAGDSNGFSVLEGSLLVCLDPDTAGTGAGGEITVRKCIGVAKPGAAPENVCISTGGAQAGTTALNGTGGDASTQNACMWYGAGFYYIDITTACVGTCRVSLEHDLVR